MTHTPILVSREVLDNDPDFVPGHLFNPTLDQPVYVVTWPEHVHFPKYNADPTYHGFNSVEEALTAWPDADVSERLAVILALPSPRCHCGLLVDSFADLPPEEFLERLKAALFEPDYGFQNRGEFRVIQFPTGEIKGQPLTP